MLTRSGLVLVFWSLGVGLAGAGDVEAVVNGRAITKAEVDAAFARTSVAKQPLTEEQKQMYRGHVINVLVDTVLLKQYLDGQGVQADPAAVDRHLKQFEQALTDKGTSLTAFLAENQATLEQMKQEVADIYQWFSHVDAQSTPENLREYFEANRAAFDGSQVRASHILVEFPPNATPAQKKEARSRMEKVRAQLAAGTDFASLAKLHSDCQSKAQGGDVGYFPRKGKMTEPFAATAFQTPVGQVSDIVESEYGFHLIKVTDHKAGQAVAYETVAEDVRSLFAADLRTAVINAMRQQSEVKFPIAGTLASQPKEAVRK